MQAMVLVPITFSVRRIGTLGSFAAAAANAWSDKFNAGCYTPPR